MSQNQVPPLTADAPLFNPRNLTRVALIWVVITLFAQAILSGLAGILPQSWVLAFVAKSSSRWGFEVSTSAFLIAGWVLVISLMIMTGIGLLLPKLSKWRSTLHGLTILAGTAFVTTAIPSVILALARGSFPTDASVTLTAFIAAILTVGAGIASFAPAMVIKRN